MLIIISYIGNSSLLGNDLKNGKISSIVTSSILGGFHIGLLSFRTKTAVTPEVYTIKFICQLTRNCFKNTLKPSINSLTQISNF